MINNISYIFEHEKLNLINDLLPVSEQQAKRKYQLMLLSSSASIDDDPGYSILYTINREREREREETEREKRI